MNVLSVCSGIGAPECAWSPLGWRFVAHAEIEPFPSAVLAHHYPGVPNRGDMTKFAEWPDADVDVLVGGTPCFPGDTLIAARRGLVPISEIVVGDLVLTHEGRWQRVLATGAKRSRTIRVTGQGISNGIVTTPDHPFYARHKARRWVGREAGSWRSEMSPAEWVRAEDMRGLFWASPAAWPAMAHPEFEPEGREATPPAMTDALAWVIGRWLGDGWTRINTRRGYALICCGDHEADALADRLRDAGLAFSRGQERTTTRFQIASRAFARWLHRNFGAGAAGKTIPTWVFGWAHKRALLDGYLSADGCRTPNGWRLTTVSRALALGAVLLAHSLGMSTTRRLVFTKRGSPEIEGRAVSERPFWQVSIYEAARSSVELEGHRWGLVRKVERDGESEVFNLEVEGDNSYVADGVVVHNCQSFSVAGLRKGLADPRGNLALTFLAIADRFRPAWVVWENVPGVLSSAGGRDFGAFLGGLGELGYGWAYRVLDAQHFGLAQRRKRVFVVASARGWASAAAVLFERESLSGHPAPSREAGEGAAADAVGSLTASGRGVERVGESRGQDPVIAMCLNAKGGGGRIDGESETFVATTLRARDGAKGVDSDCTDTLVPIAFSCKDSGADAGNMAPTLRAMGHSGSHANAGGQLAVACQQVVALQEVGKRTGSSTTDPRAGIGISNPGDPMFTLQAGAQHGVAGPHSAVRRLLPVECEKLQGFPPGWTDIPFRGKPAADGPRYRALGNSMAVPVVSWIGQRIQMVDDLIREIAASEAA